jgi:hypothetical protein
MATTIAYPADPVVKGATEIQSTTFANDAADYSEVTWSRAKSIVSGFPSNARFFPKGTNEDPNWSFYIRNDMAGASANKRSVFGVKRLMTNSRSNQFDPSNGQIIVPHVDVDITIHAWTPYQVTLDSGVSYTRIAHFSASIELTIDPTNGDVLVDSNVAVARHLDEVVGFLILRAAATAPVLTPALNIVAGVDPLG